MNPLRTSSIGLCALLLAACPSSDGDNPEPAEEEGASTPEQPVEEPKAAALDPCSLPTKKADGDSPMSVQDHTAWQLFVAAMCPTGNPAGQAQLAFETWTEQSCLTAESREKNDCKPDGGSRHLHGSHFLAKGAEGESPADFASTCSSMQVPGLKGFNTALAPFVADNLVPYDKSTGLPQFCEEVFVNDDELAYIEKNGLGDQAGQVAYISGGNTIDFPGNKATDTLHSVEIKVDWLPASSLKEEARFDCSNPPADVFTETIGDECYALTGIHISSKLYDKWVWSTFEPTSSVTNPNRCKGDLYGNCLDNWGTTEVTTTHGSTGTLSEGAKELIAAAKLPAAFQSYRLTGTQSEFEHGATVTIAGTETPYNLGSSFTELNAAVSPAQASCITCHNAAQIEIDEQNPTGKYHSVSGGVGDPNKIEGGTAKYPAEPPWQTLDFSWMLGIGD